MKKTIIFLTVTLSLIIQNHCFGQENILFQKRHLYPIVFSSNNDLLLATKDFKETIKLNQKGEKPQWHENGKLILFQNMGRIWIYNLESGELTDYAEGHSPRWIDDSNTIIFKNNGQVFFSKMENDKTVSTFLSTVPKYHRIILEGKIALDPTYKRDAKEFFESGNLPLADTAKVDWNTMFYDNTETGKADYILKGFDEFCLATNKKNIYYVENIYRHHHMYKDKYLKYNLVKFNLNTFEKEIKSIFGTGPYFPGKNQKVNHVTLSPSEKTAAYCITWTEGDFEKGAVDFIEDKIGTIGKNDKKSYIILVDLETEEINPIQIANVSQIEWLDDKYLLMGLSNKDNLNYHNKILLFKISLEKENKEVLLFKIIEGKDFDVSLN